MAYNANTKTVNLSESQKLASPIDGIFYKTLSVAKNLSLEEGDIVARTTNADTLEGTDSLLSSFAITAGDTIANFDDGPGFWELTVDSVSATFEIFNASTKLSSDKIATGTLSATSGSLSFTEANSSGVAGSVTVVSGAATDTDLANLVIPEFMNYSKLDASSYTNKTVVGVTESYDSDTGELVLIAGNAQVRQDQLDATNLAANITEVNEKLQAIGIYVV